jgi:hypothetical protein
MGPDGRLRTAMELSRFARTFFEAGIKLRNPGFSDKQVKREAIRLLYGVTIPG